MDITPKYPLPSAEQEVLVFQGTDGQLVGGFMASPGQLKQGQMTMNAVGEQLLIGAATAPLTGIGIFVGNAGDNTYDFRAGNPSGNYIHWDQSAGTLTIAGSIGATSGTIGGFDVGADYIRDAANTFGLASTVTGGDDVRFWAGASFASRASAPFRVTEAGVAAASNFTITGGSVATSVLNTSVLRATSDITFSSTDNDTIAWSSGSIRTAAGITFTISSGNTGNMAALTYIYLDTAVSTTVLQTTTTYSTAVGDGKVLVATAQNQSSGGAYCIPFLGGAPLLNGAGQINASSILAAQISVSQLSAITADLGTMTAGTVTGATVQTASSGSRFVMTSTAFQGKNAGGDNIFEVLISGANAGDVTMGKVSTGKYAMWDDSAGTFTVFGAIGVGADVQTFSADGTWTKPTAGTYTYARVQVWGAGGSGGAVTQNEGASTGASGGGGAEYAEQIFLLSDLGATETVTVGVGGAAVSSSTAGNDGNAGENSSFGSHLTANGGGAGLFNVNAADVDGGAPGDSVSYGSPYAGSGSSAGAFSADAVKGLYAAAGAPVVDTVGRAGGKSIFGGGGGGSAHESAGGTAGAGGTSKYGGNGGAASITDSVNGTSGAARGGGGGAYLGPTTDANSGAGGNGFCVVSVF